jgi:hypothetical protein
MSRGRSSRPPSRSDAPPTSPSASRALAWSVRLGERTGTERRADERVHEVGFASSAKTRMRASRIAVACIDVRADEQAGEHEDESERLGLGHAVGARVQVGEPEEPEDADGHEDDAGTDEQRGDDDHSGPPTERSK